MDDADADVCRVCRMEGSKTRPLFHPCVCSGSIRYVHQECLLEWLRVSKKDYCELCKHKVTFKPIYSADMPARIPVSDLLSGLTRSLMRALGCWVHYTAVALAWLGFVPLVTCRIYYSLFSGSVHSLLMIPYDLFSTEHFMRDIVTGCFIVGCTMGIFVCLLYLREQFMQGQFQNIWDLNHDNQQRVNQEPEEENEMANEVAEIQRLLNEQLNEQVVQDDQAAAAPAQAPPDPPDVHDDMPANEIFNEGDNQEPVEQWNLEELTWERMLGLDGSFVFLEHVFWVVSLNTLFILLFAYIPHQLGRLVLSSFLPLTSPQAGVPGQEPGHRFFHFEGAINTIVGYCMFGFMFMVSHVVSGLMNMDKLSKMAKLIYICIKAAIFILVESAVMPLLCGCWIDFCSLSLLNATKEDRLASYNSSPGACLGFHWLIGMLFMFYFYTFFLFMKEVLRPGLIRDLFDKNLNDPEFNPIKEMMHMPTQKYISRFAKMLALFGVVLVFIVYVPVKFIKWAEPDFLPYRVFAISDEPLNHVSLELVTLQVFLPTLLEQTHIKIFLKGLIRLWAEVVGHLLDLRGYLLGEKVWRNFNEAIAENNDDNGDQADRQPEVGGAGFLRGEGESDDENEEEEDVDDNGENDEDDDDVVLLGYEIRTHHVYNKPAYFKLRISILIALVALSLATFAGCVYYFPVLVGRKILGAVVGNDRKVHEMYTLFLGLFVCWLPLLGITIVSRWAPMGRQILFKRLRKKLKIGAKIVFAFCLVAGGIALLFGLLFDLVFLTPLRVPLHQSPITYVLVDWAFGAVHVKIAVAFTLLGPNWWLRDALETIYNQGARNFQMRNFMWIVVWPVASTLIIMLTIPYIVAFGLVPLIPVEEALILRFQRRVYPAFFFGALGMFILHIQYIQFCRLIESIKNSKYLVGQRLVNYDPTRKKPPTTTSEQQQQPQEQQQEQEQEQQQEPAVVEAN